MKFKVSSELRYEAQEEGTIILNVHALRTPSQVIMEESISVVPEMKCIEMQSADGNNRFLRIQVPSASDITINYSATVETNHVLVDLDSQPHVPVSELSPSVFPFLYPSRYCQSDKLYRFANSKFGSIENPFQQVYEITQWINRNVEYLSGSTNSQTSAYDTIAELAGVCRDFAHLGIALCRALTIPARYFTGYAYQLQPPDFHACFEAYIGGRWILFDATGLAPLNGLVKIATGRDAADTAVANIFGNINGISIVVDSAFIGETFEPLFYNHGQARGMSYE